MILDQTIQNKSEKFTLSIITRSGMKHFESMIYHILHRINKTKIDISRMKVVRFTHFHTKLTNPPIS